MQSLLLSKEYIDIRQINIGLKCSQIICLCSLIARHMTDIRYIHTVVLLTIMSTHPVNSLHHLVVSKPLMHFQEAENQQG